MAASAMPATPRADATHALGPQRAVNAGRGADQHQRLNVLGKPKSGFHGNHTAERYARNDGARQACGVHHGEVNVK
jgi:hypothetical protein